MRVVSALLAAAALTACTAPGSRADQTMSPAASPAKVTSSQVGLPPASSQSCMVYDSTRDVVILFGGSSSTDYRKETYTWDGRAWRLAASAGPSPRFGCAMAYDPIRKVAVLYGGWGNTGPTPNGPLDDTWTWDGRGWSEQHPLHNPPARAYAAMAFDAANGKTVIFGGQGVSTTYNGTWTWDGTDWTLEEPAHSPSPRRYAAMTYDGTRRTVVVFGGSLPGTRDDDTWIWNGRDWTQLHTEVAPAGRALAGMAFDEKTGTTVLFGGLDVGNDPLGDTWTWDGRVWTQQTPARSPSPRIGHGTAYDAAVGTVVMFGGVSQGVIGGVSPGHTNETWAWDGTTWRSL